MDRIKPEKPKTPPAPLGKIINKKSARVTDAEIISEVKEPKKEEVKEKVKEPIKQSEEKPKSKTESKQEDFIEGTQNISLDDDKQEDKTAKVNFMNKNFMEDFINKKTEKSNEEGEVKIPKDSNNKSTEESNTQSAEAPIQAGLSPDDFHEFAKVFMEVLDMGIAQLLRIYAKDNSSESYELNKTKIERLSKQLGNLFIKYNTKFSLEFMFVVTLCICYSGPYATAKARKQEIKDNGGIVPKRTGRPGKN